MAARVEHLVTSGTFTLDGQTFDVDNNVWLLGDDEQVLVIEATISVMGLRDRDGGGQVSGSRATHAVGDDQHVRAGEGGVLVVFADPSHLGVDAEVEGEHRPHTSSFIMVRPMRRMSLTPIGVGSVMRLPFT